MSYTFNYCTALASFITINSTPELYEECFCDTRITEILGDCDEEVKAEILATKTVNKNI